MKGVGESFPEFSLKGVVSTDLSTAFKDFSNKDFDGKWLVVFFWPKDFTFVCPTEITGFGELNSQFEEAGAKIIGVSTDSEFVHLAWKKEEAGLANLPFPMLSDIRRELVEALGVLDEKEGVAQRATFIVDPEGTIRFVMVTDLNVGRNPAEVLRILKALQTGGLTPCNWQPGQDTLKVG
ncbi:MAG: peroxiredoxin [Candidatus Hydrogenedentota bacterium]|nr:MAG: peroxiredoxin [Candidatus Hydrogenedentota bacterium]